MCENKDLRNPQDGSRKVIGVYPICNTGGLLVHDIDHMDDRILVSVNGKAPEWCDIITDARFEFVPGFCWGKMFVPLREIMRV